MVRFDWIWPEKAERGRKPALIAASVALHVAVLGYMALRNFESPALPGLPPPSIAIPVDLTPRPLLENERPREPAPARAAEALPLAAAATASPLALPRGRKKEDEEQPAAPTGRIAAPAPSNAPAPPAGAWQVQPETLRGAIARSLRQGIPGCRMMWDQLSAAEQARCDGRFNEAAGRAAPLAGTGRRNAERDARFAAEGARELRRYEAQRAPLRGGVGVVGPGDCVGSNLGVGCAGAHLDPSMQQGGQSVVRQDSNRLDGPRRF